MNDLKIGNYTDARGCVDSWYLAKICDVKHIVDHNSCDFYSMRILVNYLGWGTHTVCGLMYQMQMYIQKMI